MRFGICVQLFCLLSLEFTKASDFAQNVLTCVKRYRSENGLPPEHELLPDDGTDMPTEEVEKKRDIIETTHSGEDKTISERYVCWGPLTEEIPTTLDETIIMLKNILEEHKSEIVNQMFYKLKVGTLSLEESDTSDCRIVVLEFQGDILPEMTQQINDTHLFDKFVNEVHSYRGRDILQFDQYEKLKAENSAKMSFHAIQHAYLWKQNIAAKIRQNQVFFTSAVPVVNTQGETVDATAIVDTLVKEKRNHAELLIQNALELGVGYVTGEHYYLVAVYIKINPTQFEDELAKQIDEARKTMFQKKSLQIETSFTTKTDAFLNFATQQMALYDKYPTEIKNPECLAFVTTQFTYATNTSRMVVMNDLRKQEEDTTKTHFERGAYYYNSPTKNYTAVGVSLTPTDTGLIQSGGKVCRIAWKLALAFVYEGCDPYAPPNTNN